MEAVAQPEQAVQDKKQRRSPPEPEKRCPYYDLVDSVAVAQAIHGQGGGMASRDQLASFLGYRTTNSGAFVSRIAAARQFDVIKSDGGVTFTLTPLGQKIIAPVYPEQVREGLLEAFFNVPLFKSIYEEHKGRELPPAFGMQNLLRTKYGMAADQTARAYGILMDSADAAGLFATRGARTHLIIPQITRPAGTPLPPTPNGVTTEPGGGGGGAGDGGAGDGAGGNGRGDGREPPAHLPPPQGQTAEQVRLEYVRKLIWLLGTEGAATGELMDRIERLLKEGGK